MWGVDECSRVFLHPAAFIHAPHRCREEEPAAATGAAADKL